MYFFIKSYGCQMNSYDSTRITDALLNEEYKITDNVSNANIVIFNTCSIREKADEKLFSDLGRANILKSDAISRGSDFMIIVTGCVAQTQSHNMLKRAPYVDAIVGPQDIHRIPSIITDILQQNKKTSIVSTTLNTKDKFRHLTPDFRNRSYSEFLTIQEGCDNFCTYCVVPYTRGREISRDASNILEEAKKLIALGVKEITLLGQNVNSYRGLGTDGKTWGLSRLLFALAELDNLKRLRYITSNPKDIKEDIGKAHKEIDTLMPFLHLPVQSGSDEILKKMNRKYTSDEYLKCIDMLRTYRPDIAFSSDFIVGFPNETEKDFEDTIKLAEKVRFAQAYSFKYSPREKTAAATMEGQIAENIKSKRLLILQNILNFHQAEFNHKSVGKTLSVLLVKDGKHKNQLVGRSEYSQAVSICDNSIGIGDIVNAKITEVKSHSLAGLVER